MERHRTLTDWKTQYCLKVKSLQTNLQVQCNYTQNPSRNFLGTSRQVVIKTFIQEGKGASGVKTILKKDKYGISLLDFKAYCIAAHSHCMILAKG